MVRTSHALRPSSIFLAVFVLLGSLVLVAGVVFDSRISAAIRPATAIGHQRSAAVAMPVTDSAGANNPLVVVGDSWTSGIGLPPGSAYPQLLAAKRGVSVRVLAVPATGFLAGQVNQRSYAQRIAALPVDSTASMIIVQTSLADVGAGDTNSLSAAVQHTIAVIRQRFPSSTLLVLGPIPASTRPVNDLLALDSTVAAATASSHERFVSPIAERWDASAPGAVIDPATGRMSVEGHRLVADRLERDLDASSGLQESPTVPGPSVAPIGGKATYGISEGTHPLY